MKGQCALVLQPCDPLTPSFFTSTGLGVGAVPRLQAKRRGAKAFEPDADAPLLAGELGRAGPWPWPRGTGVGERMIELAALSSPILSPS